MLQVAQQNFPNKFVNGQLKPGVRFAMKLQDGDGVDGNGDSVANKEGFAGHWIVKMATRFAPRCFPAGRYDPASEIQNPENVVKCGHYVRIGVTIDGNGVEDGNAQAVQGLFISQSVIEFLGGIGMEITSGPDAAEVFGGSAAVLPAGVLPVGNIATAGNPGALPNATSLPPSTGTPSLPPTTSTPALPGLPAVGAPALPGLPPAQPAAPTYGPGPQLPAGVTVEAALGTAGYTPEMLIAAGYIVRTN